MFTRAIARTFRTLSSSHFAGLLIKTMLLTLIAFTLFLIAIGFGMTQFVLFEDATLELAADIGTTIFVGIATYLLLPVLLPAIAAFFQESIANRIENKDYPEFMPPACERPLMAELWEDTKFVGLVLALNILLIWTYFIPFVGFFTYYGLNGYLIGREFFETAAARHIGKKNAKKLRKENSTPVFLCGAAIVFLTNIPLVQLIAPFVGVAVMVHLYHLMPKSEEILPPVKKADDSPETA